MDKECPFQPEPQQELLFEIDDSPTIRAKRPEPRPDKYPEDFELMCKRYGPRNTEQEY